MGKKTKKLKFDDITIRDFISDFGYLDKEGKVKRKKQSFTPFNIQKKTRLRGLKLCQRFALPLSYSRESFDCSMDYL